MLKKFFMTGILLWLPIIVTVWVVKFILTTFDDLTRFLPHQYQPETLLGVNAPGLGVVFALLFILLTGAIASHFLGDKIVKGFDKLMKKIPLVGTVYSTVKQVAYTIISSNGNSFREVLLVEYPLKGAWSIGFQTNEIKGPVSKAAENDELISVFIPTTPNPTTGFLAIVPKSDVRKINITVDQAFKIIVSLGTLSAEEAKKLPKKD